MYRIYSSSLIPTIIIALILIVIISPNYDKILKKAIDYWWIKKEEYDAKHSNTDSTPKGDNHAEK